MKRSWSIVLVGMSTPSTNQLERMHWGAKKQIRQRFARSILYSLHAAGWRRPAQIEDVPKMRLTVRLYRKRLYDQDNAVGGLKPMIDGMRDIGALRNDSPTWLELIVLDQIQDGVRPRIEITLEEEL